MQFKEIANKLMIITNFKEIKTLIDKSELLIFDFDGVLVDSTRLKARAFGLLYKPYGDEVVEKILLHNESFGGLSRFEKIAYYHLNFLGQKIDNSKIIQLAGDFSELVKAQVIASPEIPGSNNFLESYNGKIKCVINSATPQSEIREIIEERNMSAFFLEILGSPSSKVENLNKLLKSQSTSVDQALFFGDTESDLQAAEEVGVKFVGVGDKMIDILSSKKEIFYHINDFLDVVD